MMPRKRLRAYLIGIAKEAMRSVIEPLIQEIGAMGATVQDLNGVIQQEVSAINDLSAVVKTAVDRVGTVEKGMSDIITQLTQKATANAVDLTDQVAQLRGNLNTISQLKTALQALDNPVATGTPVQDTTTGSTGTDATTSSAGTDSVAGTAGATSTTTTTTAPATTLASGTGSDTVAASSAPATTLAAGTGSDSVAGSTGATAPAVSNNGAATAPVQG